MVRSWSTIRRAYTTLGGLALLFAFAGAGVIYLMNAITAQTVSSAAGGGDPAAPGPSPGNRKPVSRRRRRRRWLRAQRILLSLGSFLGALVVAGAAFAYWTSTGSGEGRVKAQASAASFTLENGTEPTGLYPGGTREATVKIKNAEPFGERYKKLAAEVKEVENPASTETEAEAGSKCWAGWFEITEVGGQSGTSYEFNETVAASSTVEKKVTVKMKEVEKNQNGCQNKKVTLKYKVE